MSRQPTCKVLIEKEALTRACELYKIGLPLSKIIIGCNLSAASRPTIKMQIGLYTSLLPLLSNDTSEGLLEGMFLPPGFDYKCLGEYEEVGNGKIRQSLEADGNIVCAAYTDKMLDNLWYATQIINMHDTVEEVIEHALFPINQVGTLTTLNPIKPLKRVTFEGIYPIGTWDTNE